MMRETKYLIFQNCFIPHDGKLRLCHLTVEDTIIIGLHFVTSTEATATLNSHDHILEYGDAATMALFLNRRPFGQMSTTTIHLPRRRQHHHQHHQHHYDQNNRQNQEAQNQTERQEEERIPLEEVQACTFECAGKILCPGFIDLQINGAFGVDFSDPQLRSQDVVTVASQLVKYGVTHFCPTMVSSSSETYRRTLSWLGPLCLEDRLRSFQCPAEEDPNGDDNHDEECRYRHRSKLLGIHLEGPFFAKSKRGAHRAEFIPDDITPESFVQVYGSEAKDLWKTKGVSIVTLAPELPGLEEHISCLSKNDVVVSMGHTDATYQEGLMAVEEHGVSLMTHLFNAMRPFHHREPGLLGLLSRSSRSRSMSDGVISSSSNNSISSSSSSLEKNRPLFYSIIADGLHSHPTSVQMAYTLSPHVVLVTDAISAMGLDDGEHALGGESVTVSRGKATLRGTDTLAGSVASMDACIRSFWKFTGCSIYEAIQAATENPARVLDMYGELGRIAVGNRADFVIVDEDLYVVRTVVSGTVVYQREEDS